MNATRTTWFMALMLIAGGAFAYFSMSTRPHASAAGEPIRCDYEGVTYAENDQRPDNDGCNVCTCTLTGWDCTTLRCPAGIEVGTIQGRLSTPDGTAATIKVCAVSRIPETEEICQLAVKGSQSYTLRVPSGSYVVYAAQPESANVRKAYWSEFVACGAGETCLDHSPIEMKVEPKTVVEAHPEDWNAPASVIGVTVTPSKRYDLSYYVRRGGVITIYGKGFSGVRLSGVTYPPDETVKDFELGEATLESTDENGVQRWKFPIPYGLDASDIRVVGQYSDGLEYRWRSLGFVRWDDTPPTEEEPKWIKP